VDWSWDRQAVCVLDEGGAVLDRFEVEHRSRSLRQMCDRLRRWDVRRVSIERPDGPVVQVLLEAGLEVVVISPRQVRAFRIRHGTAGNKDDRFDAYVLADALRTDGHRIGPLRSDRDDTRVLRALVRARKDLIEHRIALSNQLLANLQQAFPGAVGVSPSSTARSPSRSWSASQPLTRPRGFRSVASRRGSAASATAAGRARPSSSRT
jgi:hypothetical protein